MTKVAASNERRNILINYNKCFHNYANMTLYKAMLQSFFIYSIFIFLAKKKNEVIHLNLILAVLASTDNLFKSATPYENVSSGFLTPASSAIETRTRSEQSSHTPGGSDQRL